MKMKAKGAPFLILIFMVCACQQSQLEHIVINTTNDNMTLKYKTVACNDEYIGGWEPETRGEADFKNNKSYWTKLREGEFTLEKGKESAEASDNNIPKKDCATQIYTLNVAPHTAVKIHSSNSYNEKLPLKLLELKGSGGDIKYEGTAALIMENFKFYNNDYFNFFGNSHDVLWYENAEQ